MALPKFCSFPGGRLKAYNVTDMKKFTDFFKSKGTDAARNPAQRYFQQKLVAAKYRRPELERTLEAMGRLTAYTKQLGMAMFNDAVTDWYRDEFVREHLGGGKTA